MKTRQLRQLAATFLFAASLHAVPFSCEAINKLPMEQILPLLTPMAGTTPAQWRVIWHGDPSTEAKISWSTAEPGNTHVVYYDTTDHGLDLSKYKHQITAYKNGKYRSDLSAKTEVPESEIGYFHHANLSQLQPDTNYYFVISSDDALSRRFYIKTAPAGDVEFSLLNGGDSRTGLLNRCRMNLRMVDLVEKNPSILALAHGGDYVNKGSIWKDWRLWLSHNELMTCDDGRVIPIIPTRGNHDVHEMYDCVFDVPYRHITRLPLQTNIMTLDSNKDASKAQADWMHEHMQALAPQSRWLLTMYHAPIYPAVKSASRFKQPWSTCFDQYYVDLAMEADGHCIKRSKAIRADAEHEDGVIYIGEGGLGVGSRKPKDERWFLEKTGRGEHVFLLNFTKDEIQLRVVTSDGSIFDDFKIDSKMDKRT